MRLLKTCELYRVPSGCASMNDISSTTPPNTLRQRRPLHTGRPDRCDRVALVLQRGSALGAYHSGVYQAMHEADIMPDWVAGVSIGAINAAIIAGNPPHRRIAQLHAFWDLITERKIWAYTPDGDVFGGQPGFFTPRSTSPWLSFTGAQGATSYYDSSPLKETLNDLVDFSIINDQAIRFAVGAVNVLTGNFIYFDNYEEEIGPEHVMAGGALPPALPMIKIGTDHFWDGGIVSNTPLQHLLEQDDSLNKLVFQVDLFSARGALLRDIQDVLARQKDIMYSSRTRYNTDVYRRIQKWKIRLYEALTKVPDEQLTDEERRLRDELAKMPETTILHIIYQQKAYEGHAKDYEFSGTSMREHWQSGYEDTKRTLKRREWLAIPSREVGVLVHHVHREHE